MSPFCESLEGPGQDWLARGGSVQDDLGAGRAGEQSDFGWVWIAVAMPVALRAPDAAKKVALRLRLQADTALPTLQDESTDPLPRRRAAPVPAAARTAGEAPGSRRWESFFDAFPCFSSGDPYFDRYFDFRIHGLGLNRVEGGCGSVRLPAIAEGPAYFHVPIAYSAPCHMMEMRWHSGGEEAWGSILNFLFTRSRTDRCTGVSTPTTLRAPTSTRELGRRIAGGPRHAP